MQQSQKGELQRLSKRADKKRPGVAKQPRPVAVGGVFLLQRVVNGSVLAVEIGAETIHDRDDSNRDAGCDAAISPYSIAVAPDSSRQNFRINSFIVLLSVRGLRASFNLRRLSVTI
jgi:hypothetical protein